MATQAVPLHTSITNPWSLGRTQQQLGDSGCSKSGSICASRWRNLVCCVAPWEGKGEAPGAAGSIDRLSWVLPVIVVLISGADASSQRSACGNKHTYLTNRHHPSCSPSFLPVLVLHCCFDFFARCTFSIQLLFSIPKYSDVVICLQTILEHILYSISVHRRICSISVPVR
ncbi:hypothetical protein PpBr36_08610 [Pyricularia pennisetigena]|uniref:hypothetical protein n=1 Tax=Pyricularia pennisetigena TaxID=1578925 RepID=UPI001150544A|nr:hypothetical protein PpBr36_08610 [Pyricularia pennisetigena]TLS24307.1 hypothetical protein PpBr36_08610 [Pyricularia pennisetigena]